MDYSDRVSHICCSPSAFTGWREFTFVYHWYIYWLLCLCYYFMPATTWILESLLNLQTDCRQLRQIILWCPCFLLPTCYLQPHAFSFYFLLSLYTHRSETRRSEGQNVLSQGGAGHTHTNKYFPPVFGYNSRYCWRARSVTFSAPPRRCSLIRMR
jgi:hypothetical protein